MRWVVGFDLSLTAPAAVALPLDWRPGQWKRVKSWLSKPLTPSDLEGQLIRYGRIASWAQHLIEDLPSEEDPACFVEEYAFSKNAKHSSALREAGGCVKLWLYERCGVVLRPVASNTARKLFLGALSGRGLPIKVAVQDALFNVCGAPKTWDENQADAFVIANYGLSELGGTSLTLAEPPRKGAARRR